MPYSGKLYINGKWKTGRGHAFESINPATGETVWKGNAASAEDIEEAVSGARRAFHDWAWKPLAERAAIVKKFQEIAEGIKEDLARILSQETGKTLWDARSEITAMIGKFTLTLAAYNERTGEKHADAQGFKTGLHHKPYGVVAVYSPYNFPMHLPNGHIMPAIIAGNTVVLKPSELTPLSAEKMIECWEKAGLPEGVLNLIQGERDTGKILSAHPGLDGLFFTGSSATGKILHKQFAEAPHKILALELGGNNPLIVHEVSDAKAAAYWTIQSAYVTSGQRCTCARRLIVPKGSANDVFVDALVKMAGTIKVGRFDETPEPFMGPLISNAEVNRILAEQDRLAKAGGKVLLTMKRLHETQPFVAPGLIDVTNVKDRVDEEFFGPMLQLIRVSDLDAAIAEANNTKYGLSSGIFTDKREHFEKFLKEIRAGIANWNRPLTGSSGTLPFGGVGQSGNNRPAAYYSADYCAYPVASNETEKTVIPTQVTPGLTV
jgi:succinylglutamic semialdehyde dehydrogenase